MTFTELQTDIMARLNHTSSDASTRIGREINIRHRQITSAPWLDPYRRTRITANTTNGSADVTFTSCEKIERVIDLNTTPDTVLMEVTYDEIAGLTLASSSTPTRFAIKSATVSTITITLDVLASGVFSLSADVLGTVSDLSGSNDPAFPASFHHIIIDGVLADEYRKLEKIELAQQAEARFVEGLDKLRTFCTKTHEYARRGAPLN